MPLHLHFPNTSTPTNDTNRPFVPSVAPEDVEKARNIGILSPKSLNQNDLIPKPFIKKLPTWAQKTKKYDLYSLGADGLEGGFGDDADIGNWISKN